MWCGVVCSVVWCGVVRCGVVWCDVVVSFGMVWHGIQLHTTVADTFNFTGNTYRCLASKNRGDNANTIYLWRK